VRAPPDVRRGAATHAAVAAATATILAACARPVATPSELDAYRDRAGTLVVAETSAAEPRGRYAMHGVRLVSGTGLATVGRLFVPARGPGCYPAVLLQDGREENSKVNGRLPDDFGDVVVLSLDYPPAMPMALRVRDVLLDRSRIRRAAAQIPSLFLLGAEYLAQRRDVDTSRMALAATSFAVPFATIAAASDERFREVALIYGAGDLPGVLAANLTTRPRVLRRPLAWLATRPFAALAPERFIGLVAPRRIVFVNGIDDPQMPTAAVQQLYDAAREPKSLTWLRTGHLMPTDSALIRALVDTAFAKMSVLRAPADSGRCRVDT
jgi:fermentation-respiration switch protein FrsA (DUF1100 family)